MCITGAQYEIIQRALLDAFDEAELQQLCRIRLDVDFDAIVEPGPLEGRVYRLVAWAERRGRIPELIAAAYNQNSGNLKLQALIKSAQKWAECKTAGLVVTSGQASVASSRQKKPRVTEINKVTPIEQSPATGLQNQDQARRLAWWIATAIIIPVLLIVSGLYLEHNPVLLGGPTQSSATETQPDNQSGDYGKNHAPALEDTVSSSMGELPVTTIEASPISQSPVTPTLVARKTNPVDGAAYVLRPRWPFYHGFGRR